MPVYMTCPQGHRWEPIAGASAETALAEVSCPVCGVAVRVAPAQQVTGGGGVETEVIPAAASAASAAQAETQAHVVAPSRERDAAATLPLARPEPADFDGGGPEVPGYVIVRELGRGGMGVVYLAHQVGLDRFVALKMILAGSHAGPEELQRFRTEAAVISRLQHPNLVNIYEVREHEGKPFFSMEFVDGGNLDDQLGGKPMAARDAAQMIATLARAMHCAHQKGIVHRDLKPGNVLLTRDGIPKITDFGLAKRLDVGQGQTQTGSIMGTPSYMAPEQAAGRGKEIGPHTDVYSLGAMLYELLTGRPPFLAETGWDTIVEVVSNEPLPPSSLQPRLPRDLETICLKCLEKDARKRYASAAALADDVERFLRHEPIQARPISAVERLVKWGKRRPAVASALGISLAAAVIVLTLGARYHLHLQQLHDDLARHHGELERSHDESQYRLIRLHVANGARLLDEHNWYGALVWFTEALRLEEAAPVKADLHRLRVAAVLRACPRVGQLWFHGSAVHHASFSPDGLLVITATRDGNARLWDVASGQQVGQTLRHDGVVWQAWFSGDGQRVLTSSGDGTARVWQAHTGHPLTNPLRHNQGTTAPTVASFSPDGLRVLTVGGDNQARLWDASSGKLLPPLLRHDARVHYAAFSPDGRAVVTAAADHTARVWNADSGQLQTTLRGHTDVVTFATFSPDNRLLVTAGTDQTARLWQRDAAGAFQAVATLRHQDAVKWAAFSPDSQRLLTASYDDSVKVWSTVSHESLVPPLRHGSNVRRYAAFSPDGAWIVTSSDDNTARLWSAATGAPLTTKLIHHGTVHCAAISPNGHHVVTVSDDTTACLWELATDSLLASTAALADAPAPPADGVSADGLRKILITDRSARVLDAATGTAISPPLRHASTITRAAFSPDGLRVVTASNDNSARIWDALTGELLAPPLAHHGTVLDAVFSHDGLAVVTASADHSARVWNAATGNPISPLILHPRPVVQASFHADGRQLVTITSDRVARTWDIPGDHRPVDVLLDLARLLAGVHIDSQGRYLPLSVDELQDLWNKYRATQPEVRLATEAEVDRWRRRLDKTR